MVNPLLTLLVSLSLAFILSELLKFFKLPRVIGQLGAGFILGIPFLKNLLFDNVSNEIFSFLANMGIILLFYFVGLEINLLDFEKNVKSSVWIAFFNTMIPLLLGFIVSKFVFHLDTIACLIVGISLGVSSQAISLDILEEAKLLKSKIAKMIITEGAVDDIFEFILISILLLIFHITTGNDGFLPLALGIVFFIGLVFLMRFFIIPFALRQFEKEHSKTTLFMGALMIVLIIAYLAEVFKIGSLIGALIAGMLVRQSLLKGKNRKPWEEHDIAKSVHLISFGLFVPFFFVWVGVNTDFLGIGSQLGLVLSLIGIGVLGTVGGTALGCRLSGGTWKQGLIVGWGLLPKGDTELVVATLALSSNLIDKSLFSAIILTAFIMTAIAPIGFTQFIKKKSY